MQISAKDLGWLKTSSFCPRCFWIARHDRHLPFQTPFAGIFSSIDAYTKSVVAKHFERHGRLPDWLAAVGDVKRLVKVDSSGFRVEKDGVTFTGIPDELFERPDASYGIIDYKTARYTGTQDALMPVYEVQLNGYAYIAEAIGYKPVNDLYLAYFEPPQHERFDELTGRHTTREGFEMPFTSIIHRVRKDTKEIERLLERASRIYEMKKPPEGKEGCEDCARLEELVKLVD
jgi:CRISPR/Cas system-associated exonuclease Cas4 (RecB family)